jgi:hypothetical protein
MSAHSLLGETVDGWSIWTTTWIALAEPGRSEPSRWQRVMWHPALDSTPGRVDVRIHGSPARHRRLMIEWPGGARLVPIGRLRRRPPPFLSLSDRSDRHASLADSFVVPVTTLRTCTAWWRRLTILTGCAAVAGAMCGLLIIGPVAVIPFTAGAVALAAAQWASNGAEP